MSKTRQSETRSSGFLGLLFLLFLGMKLTGVIGWSWWWVTAPLWGPFAVIGVIGLVVSLILLLTGLTK